MSSLPVADVALAWKALKIMRSAAAGALIDPRRTAAGILPAFVFDAASDAHAKCDRAHPPHTDGADGGRSACVAGLISRTIIRSVSSEASEPSKQSYLGPAASKRLFVWEAVPASAAAISAELSPSELSRARLALHVLAAPLIAAADRLFMRPPPEGAEWVAEQDAAVAYFERAVKSQGANYNPSVLAALYGCIPSAIAGAPAPRSGGTTCDGYPVQTFAGNDDAEAAGAMRNPMRWGMYAQVCGGYAQPHALGNARPSV